MRILLVEDDQATSDFLETSLATQLFSVDVAHDGHSGSLLARENNYDLMVLDHMLPQKTGLEICREIRQSGKNYPIIIVSGCTETNLKIDLLDAGADDYLLKPFSHQEFLAHVRALLRRPHHLESSILHFADITLDAQKYEVRRGKKYIPLTKKEFALLEYLMKNPNIVLSRGMIMEHVWDMHANPFSNTLESHIMLLRKKIDTDPHKKLIHTVAGVGYKLSQESL